MTNLLVKLFVKDYQKTNLPVVRTRYGILSGLVGIILNVILCTVKFITGSITGSISITADAVNNLSDAGSSIVSLLGFKLSSKSADDDHPFGHGRIEYIGALVVSMFVIAMGFDLLKTSFGRIREPQPVTFSVFSAVILFLSIFGKIWLAYFNKSLGKRIDSPAMEAVAKDSLGDIAATSVTLVSLIASRFSSLPIDGYMGIVVALFIFYAGYSILKTTIGPLLGSTPDEELVKNIQEEIMSHPGIVGIHDMIIHDYGPDHLFGSIHAEVPSDCDIIDIHDTIDVIERTILSKFGVQMVIHMDPIAVNDERINALKEMVLKIVTSIDSNFTIHDFRVVDGTTHTNLIFDLVVTHKYINRKAEIIDLIERELEKKDEKYFAVVTVEQSFV